MKPRGNPAKRRRGEAVRAVLAVTLKPNQPVPLETVMSIIQLSRAGVLRHLARMEEAGRIRGYTTASGVVRVW